MAHVPELPPSAASDGSASAGTGSESPAHRKLAGNFGKVQLRTGKTLSLNCDSVASLFQFSAAEPQEVDNSKR